MFTNLLGVGLLARISGPSSTQRAILPVSRGMVTSKMAGTPLRFRTRLTTATTRTTRLDRASRKLASTSPLEVHLLPTSARLIPLFRRLLTANFPSSLAATLFRPVRVMQLSTRRATVRLRLWIETGSNMTLANMYCATISAYRSKHKVLEKTRAINLRPTY